jgi:carotenoid 9,10(9',10')-cleavage dioxygenase 1
MMAILTVAPLNYPEGKYDPRKQGNTALVFHNGTLLGLNEEGYPIRLRVSPNGALATGAPERFRNKLTHPFTAHPKVDPRTGEMLCFGYQ